MEDLTYQPKEQQHQHVTPLKHYFAVFAALSVLTGITVLQSQMDLGKWSVWIALVIATIKASLVALVFMHLLYTERYNSVVLLGGIGTASIFFVLTVVDPMSRGDINSIEAKPMAAQMTRLTARRQANVIGGEAASPGGIAPTTETTVTTGTATRATTGATTGATTQTEERATMPLPGTQQQPAVPVPVPGIAPSSAAGGH